MAEVHRSFKLVSNSCEQFSSPAYSQFIPDAARATRILARQPFAEFAGVRPICHRACVSAPSWFVYRPSTGGHPIGFKFRLNAAAGRLCQGCGEFSVGLPAERPRRVTDLRRLLLACVRTTEDMASPLSYSCRAASLAAVNSSTLPSSEVSMTVERIAGKGSPEGHLGARKVSPAEIDIA